MTDEMTGLMQHPKYYVNAFPKAGTHLVGLMIQPIAKPMPPAPQHDRPWVGSFADHSWTDKWHPTGAITYRLSRLQPGRFFLGHCGYREEIERFLWWSGTAVLFVYRDLRAVAVSQAHHVLSDEERFCHSRKDLYQAMGGFDEVLEAVIRGIDGYPGVAARWTYYEPWLDVDWVLKLRFEDVLRDRVGAARVILEYGVRRVAAIFGRDVRMNEETTNVVVDAMVETSERTDRSPTYREGRSDGWRDRWSNRAERAFEETGGAEANARLEYRGHDDLPTPGTAQAGQHDPTQVTIRLAR